jgi:ferritin-like metal-binding protein YciE
MAPSTLEEQLVKYLTDAHSIEQQALVQMRAAPKLAGDDRTAQIFNAHLSETEGHERTVDELLEQHGASPSKLKDLVGALTGAGFGAFAAAQPDTPGKLVAHAYSYEHMEAAAYHLIGRLAEQVEARAVADAAREIEGQERAMAERLEGCFDAAVDASMEALGPDDLDQQLIAYLTDAHAIEAQSLQLLAKAPELAGVPALATIYEQHRLETTEHQRLVAAELDRREVSPSKLKDAALRLGALNWGMFFQAQPDTPAKLAAFAYAFEHLEIAAYELLRRVAGRAGDSQVEALAGHILGEERAAAEKLWDLLDEALQASLEEQGLPARVSGG